MRWTGMLLAAVLACSRTREPTPRGPWLETDWTGGDTGRISAPADAEWCDSLQVLEVRALQGDSGIALAIHPAGALKAGRYPVASPRQVDSAPPGAAIALRWFAETAIKGFRSDSGELRVDISSGGILSGRFDAHLTGVNATGRIRARGDFRGLKVNPASSQCARRPDSSVVDTGVN